MTKSATRNLFSALTLIMTLAACGDTGPSGNGQDQSGGARASNSQGWILSEEQPGSEASFQGSATAILADAPSSNGIDFKNSRVAIRCPADWGNEANQAWAASIDIPLSSEYERGKERGSMAVDIDGKPFGAVQFSRTTYNIKPAEAKAFRDALVAGKQITFTPKTLDGRTGTTSAALPDGAALKAYFAKNCPAG